MVAGTRKRPPHSHAASEKLNSVVRVVQTGPPGTFWFSFAFTGAYVLAEPLVQIRPLQSIVLSCERVPGTLQPSEFLGEFVQSDGWVRLPVTPLNLGSCKLR